MIQKLGKIGFMISQCTYNRLEDILYMYKRTIK
ncbi:MAG: hypothetical protein JWN56_228 [Sphingobacteriales bacterium]|nr:hypothetical protein [Sphingobacteriales bacterium]